MSEIAQKKWGDVMEQLKAVVDVLAAEFPKCRVFTENVKAVGNRPCFLVKAVDCGLKKELNDVYRLAEKFEIVYYDGGQSDKGCVAVNEKLDVVLRRVGGLHGIKRKFEIKSGVLRVVYEYCCRVRLCRAEVKEKMSGMKIGLEIGMEMSGDE